MAGEFMSTESLRTCLGRESGQRLVQSLGSIDGFWKEYDGVGSRISRASSSGGKKTMEEVSAAVGIESWEGRLGGDRRRGHQGAGRGTCTYKRSWGRRVLWLSGGLISLPD